MGAGSKRNRLSALAAAGVIVISACGGSGDGATAPNVTGQAGVVLDTAVDVESAVVETTTPAPDPTVATTPVVTEPVVTEPAATEPVVTEPLVTAADTVPPATDPVTRGVPVGYRPIRNDSGELRTNVPAEWVQTDGAPQGDVQQLVAAEDLEGFLAGYTLPGMVLVSGEAATPESWADALAATLSVAQADGCTVSETSDYDDGVYTGTEHLMSCGTTATAAHLIGGRDADGELFFLLALVRPSDDVGIRDEIVQSFFID